MKKLSVKIPVHLLLVITGSLLLTMVVLPPDKPLWSDSQLILANFLPICLLAIVFYVTCGRLFSSISSVAILLLVIRYIHDQKIEILDVPLTSSDAALWSQILVSLELALRYVTWPAVLGVAVYLILASMLFSREAPIARIRNRLVTVAAVLLVLVPMRTTFAVQYEKLPQKPWSTDPSLRTVGIVAFLIQDYLQMKSMPTPVADQETIAATRARYESLITVPVSEQRPDIVLWLSESFFDPRIFKGIDSCEQLPTYCEMSENSMSGTLSVPTFGGKTIRTEFELLTGVPMAAVEKHHFPYMSLTNVPVNSIAWELRKQGYDTVAVHNHKRGFWRRPVALKNLGFQRWIGVEDMEDARVIGYYHADSMLTDSVIELLDETRDDTPRLIFAISMQAHGPYGKQQGLPKDQVEAIAVPEKLRAKNARILQQYLYHIQGADRELQRISSYIGSRERPTLVLYFGDHLPGLGKVYRELGFDNGLGPSKQKTPFLLFGNYLLDAAAMPAMDVAAWQIATLTMKAGNVLGDGAFAWFDLLYGQMGWSQETGAACEGPVCDALLQFQYGQLAGPEQ